MRIEIVFLFLLCLLMMACTKENIINESIPQREGILEKEIIEWESRLGTEISSLIVE